jgi:hypothetical protein
VMGSTKRIRSEQLSKCRNDAPVERSRDSELDVLDGA